MTKADFKRDQKEFYSGKVGRFDIVTVPPMNYLTYEGAGRPGGERYVAAVAALYALSYRLKFMSKQSLGRDYAVGPLQGLWWADDMETFITRDKSAWKWRMMIRQPDWLTAEQIEAGRRDVIEAQNGRKSPKANPSDLEQLAFGPYDEGLCVQVLHVGSYDDEGPLLEQMHKVFIPESGLEMTGRHHEIYIGDPRRVASERLKTILRQPVRQA